MKARAPSTLKRSPIGRRPAVDPESNWVRQADSPQPVAKSDVYTARLTLDITPALRGRIKMAAIRRGVTAAEMLRDLLEHEFREDGS